MEDKTIPTEERNERKERIGKVVSNKMQKTITVAVTAEATDHGKLINRTTKFKGSRRADYGGYRRYSPYHGDSSDKQGQALETYRDHRKGEVIFALTCPA